MMLAARACSRRGPFDLHSRHRSASFDLSQLPLFARDCLDVDGSAFFAVVALVVHVAILIAWPSIQTFDIAQPRPCFSSPCSFQLRSSSAHHVVGSDPSLPRLRTSHADSSSVVPNRRLIAAPSEECEHGV